MLLLQIFRGALLGGGGLALGNSVALSYGGGHKVVTYVAWYVLAALLLAAGVVFWVEIHRRKEATDLTGQFQDGPPGTGQGRIQGVASVGAAIRSQPDLADKAMQEIREMFERSERKKRDLVEAELVAMIDEGNALKGNAFGDGAAPSDTVLSWRESVVTFIGFALGDLERQRLLEVEPATSGTEGTIDAILVWLRQRRDDPASWEARAMGVNGPELDAAIEARRGQRPVTLADQLDALMREGIELLDELMAPAQAEEASEGVWALDFGDAPAEWWDKADAFYRKTKDLLTAEHPALIPDFERGYNERLRIQREREMVAPRQPESRSTAQKMLDFATETQRTPAKIVEACLEGLSQARKSI